MRAQMRVQFAALATVPFVMVLSNSMIIPVLPNIQNALHRSLLQVGLLITVFSITAGLVIPVGGYLADHIGRKAVMVPCLFIFGLGGLIAGLAPLFLRQHAYGGILAGRVVQGIGAGGTYQVAMALVGDIFKSNERSRVLGMLEASNGFGKVVSPVIGAAVMTIAWFLPFFVYPIIAWASAAFVWVSAEEPKGTTTDRPLGTFVQALGRVFHQKGLSLLSCFLAGALALFFLFGVLSFYSDVLEKGYHVQGVTRGLVIAIPVAVMAAAAYTMGALLVSRSGWSKGSVMTGLGVLVLAFVGMFFVHRRIMLFTAAIAAMGLGNGILLPALNSMITSAVGSAERGTLTALYGTVRFFGAALGPPVFDKTLGARSVGSPTYLGAAALAAAALVVAVVGIRQRLLLGGETERRGGGRVLAMRHATPRMDHDRLM